MNMSKFVQFMINRLGEQSTYSGLTILCTLAGIAISPDQMHSIAALGASIVGIIHTFFPDSSKKKVADDIASVSSSIDSRHPIVQQIATTIRMQSSTGGNSQGICTSGEGSTKPSNQFLS
jgi:hypothetical protein